MSKNRYKYENVPPVVSASGGFYNPLEGGKSGELYLRVEGVPKLIEISYRGQLVISNFSGNPDLWHINNNRESSKVTISSTEPLEYKDEKLFDFSGYIDSVKYVKIYGWTSPKIIANFKNYDQTNVPINKSETNFEDDSIIIRDMKKTRRINYKYGFKNKRLENRNYLRALNKNENEKLPLSYIENKKNEVGNFAEDVRLNSQDYCFNCYYIKSNNYCEKWDVKVKSLAWCKSWKKKGVR